MTETNAEYHADLEHVGQSMLKVFRRSPKEYKWRYVSQILDPEPPTPPMVLGSLTHTLLLEPDSFNDQWVLCDAKKRVGDKWQECVKIAHNTNREPALQIWAKNAEDLAESLYRNADVAKILEADSVAELPIRWTDQVTGIKCKCKPDLLVFRPGLTVDVSLKTTSDPSPAKFSKTVLDYGYHRGSAHYADGIKSRFSGIPVESIIIAVGNKPPHDVWLYRLDESYIRLGHRQNEADLADLARCLETGEWLAKDQNKLNTLYPSRWAESEE